MPLLLTNWEIFWQITNRILKEIFQGLPTNQLGTFSRFWQSNLKSPLNFSKGPFYLLWIRGTIWQGVFEKFLNFFYQDAKKRSLRISPKATPLNILFGFQQLYWFAISVRNVHSILLLIMMCVAWSRGYLFLQKVRYIWATDSSNTPRICIMAKMHTAATYFNACKGIIGRMRAIPMRITK